MRLIPEDIELENPLWDFALAHYPRLSQPLLALQAEGARVNQLLAALWCADTGRAWPGQIPAQIETWHEQQVLPIRERRTALKADLESYPEMEKLYQAYKLVELNCERVELAMLYKWLKDLRAQNSTMVEANVNSVLALNGVELCVQARTDLLRQLK